MNQQQMTPQQAVQVIKNLLDLSIKSGLHPNTESVIASINAIDTIISSLKLTEQKESK